MVPQYLQSSASLYSDVNPHLGQQTLEMLLKCQLLISDWGGVVICGEGRSVYGSPRCTRATHKRCGVCVVLKPLCMNLQLPLLMVTSTCLQVLLGASIALSGALFTSGKAQFPKGL